MYIAHVGTRGQKWGTRKYRGYDGKLTDLGRKRYTYYIKKSGDVARTMAIAGTVKLVAGLPLKDIGAAAVKGVSIVSKALSNPAVAAATPKSVLPMIIVGMTILSISSFAVGNVVEKLQEGDY